MTIPLIAPPLRWLLSVPAQQRGDARRSAFERYHDESRSGERIDDLDCEMTDRPGPCGAQTDLARILFHKLHHLTEILVRGVLPHRQQYRRTRGQPERREILEGIIRNGLRSENPVVDQRGIVCDEKRVAILLRLDHTVGS